MKHFTRVKMGVGGKWREEREKCTAKCLCLLNTHRSAVWNWAEMGKPRIPPVVIELPTLLMHSSRLAEFSCHCRAHIWYGQHALIILEITSKYLLILEAVSPWDWGPYCPATRPCSFRSIFGAQVLYQTWCSYCALVWEAGFQSCNLQVSKQDCLQVSEGARHQLSAEN